MQVAQDSVIQLEQRKQMFENQLRELEWRLEQESKVVQYFNTDNNVTILCDWLSCLWVRLVVEVACK